MSWTDLVTVWNETHAEAQRYTDSVPPSVKYGLGDVPQPPTRGFRTILTVANQDCLEAAAALQAKGATVAVLNLSDNEMAGGVVHTGARAQEESLWRRTALCVTQKQDFYPLGLEAIYSASVPVLRGTEEEGHPWLNKDKIYRVNFIACPALWCPERVESPDEPEGDLTEADKQELADRLRLILRVAAANGNDAVVLGAMGCGAWRSPPRPVAKIFRKVLPEFNGVFRDIYVAILTKVKSRYHSFPSHTVGLAAKPTNLYHIFSDVLVTDHSRV